MVENDEVTRVQAQVQTRQTGKRRNMKSRLKEGVPGAKENYLFFFLRLRKRWRRGGLSLVEF